MTGHVCRTSDGVPITVGLRVVDYDNRVGTVVEEPSTWDLADDVCWPCRGHNGHWWGVRPDDPRGDNPAATKSFDGSRLTTRGAT